MNEYTEEQKRQALSDADGCAANDEGDCGTGAIVLAYFLRRAEDKNTKLAETLLYAEEERDNYLATLKSANIQTLDLRKQLVAMEADADSESYDEESAVKYYLIVNQWLPQAMEWHECVVAEFPSFMEAAAAAREIEGPNCEAYVSNQLRKNKTCIA